MTYPGVYPTTATVLPSPAAVPGHLYRPVRQTLVARPAPETAFAVPQPGARPVWAHPTALADERRVQHTALALLMTVVLLGLPLAVFLGTLAHR